MVEFLMYTLFFHSCIEHFSSNAISLSRGSDCLSQPHTITPVCSQTLSVVEGVAYCGQLSHHPCFQHEFFIPTYRLPIPFTAAWKLSIIKKIKSEAMQTQKHKSHVGSRHMYTVYVFFRLSTPLPFTVSSSVLGYIQSLGFPAYSVFIIFQLKVSILFKVADAPVRSLHGVTARIVYYAMLEGWAQYNLPPEHCTFTNTVCCYVMDS